MKNFAKLIFTLFGATFLASAAELKSYGELGLIASDEEFADFIRSPIHLRIIQDAPIAVIYRLSTRPPSGDGSIDRLPLSKATILSEKHTIIDSDLIEFRKVLLDHSNYGSHQIDKACIFNPDYRIDFRSHDLEVSILICTSCTDVALCVNDELLEFLPFNPSLVRFYEFLKRTFKEDKFTQDLPMVDDLLPQAQRIHDDSDPFAAKTKQPASEQGGASDGDKPPN